MTSITRTCEINEIINRLHSFSVVVEDTLSTAAQKVKEAVASPIGQGIIGAGLGLAMIPIYGPLTQKLVSALGVSSALPDPFASLSFGVKILLTPFVCVLGPIMEEQTFRGDLQEGLKNELESFYASQGLSGPARNIAVRVTAIFFGSLIFGAVHFSNALFFWCNPVLFLPQVIASTIMGFAFGLAKDLSGELAMPIGMHISNNTLAWAHYLNLLKIDF